MQTAITSGNPLFQAFSLIFVQDSTDGDCIKDGRKIDPCCGIGSMFIQSAALVKSKQGDINRINVYGQEKDPDTYRLAKMNLALRGISHNLGETSDSSFLDDLHKGLYFDYIMANPPFNLKSWYDSILEHDPRWADYQISWNNIAFRVSPKTKDIVLAEYLFLHFNRSEWDREDCFRSWGSSTEVFSWDALCKMEVDLPPIDIQQKYVAVYNANACQLAKL